VVSICNGIILYEVQVRPVGKSPYIRVPVRSVLGQVGPSLTIIDLGPMAWKARDVVGLKNLLDTVYDGSSIDNGPGVGGDTKKTFDIDCWVHALLLHNKRITLDPSGPLVSLLHLIVPRPIRL
jgi:hypothetical protein